MLFTASTAPNSNIKSKLKLCFFLLNTIYMQGDDFLDQNIHCANISAELKSTEDGFYKHFFLISTKK